MTSFKHAISQLLQATFAVLLAFISILMPPLIAGADGSRCIILATLLFIHAKLLGIALCDIESKERGSALWILALIHFAMTVGLCGTASLIGGVTEYAIAHVLLAAYAAAFGLLFLIGPICWVLDTAVPERTVEVLRGRTRTESSMSFMYVPHAKEVDGEFLKHDPKSDDAEEGFDWTETPTPFGEGEKDTYERFVNCPFEIPEEEYDPSYVFDMRNPYRLPLRKDSKFRPLFECSGGPADA